MADDPLVDIRAAQEARRAIVLGAYGRLFGEVPQAGDAAIVLADLRAFCHVDRDMFSPEAPTLMANLLGRYRVWQRIEGLTRGDAAGFDPSGWRPPEEAPARAGRPRRPAGGGPLLQEGETP